MRGIPKAAEEAWKREYDKHAGDYGDSTSTDLEAAFIAGWLSRHNMKKQPDIGCAEKGCTNKYYKHDRISPTKSIPQCKKHYRIHALGWSEYEAGRGKRE